MLPKNFSSIQSLIGPSLLKNCGKEKRISPDEKLPVPLGCRKVPLVISQAKKYQNFGESKKKRVFESSGIFRSGQETYSVQYIYHVKFQLLSFNMDVLWQRCQCINKQSPQKGTENNVAGYRSPLC